MDAITVSVQLTPEDAVQARRLDRARNTWVGRHGTALFVIVLGVHVFAIVAIVATRSVILIPLGGVMVLTNWGIVAYRALLSVLARRAYRNDPVLNRPFTIEISEFGVRRSGYSAQGSRRWAEIPRWTQGELLYLIYAPDGTYYVVPKRFMPDATALGE